MFKQNYFTKDKSFYKTFFSLLFFVALQNIVAYSVNMADNIMLGAYSQTALSGAASVNQVFFIVQQTAIAIGDALAVLAAQYWGKADVKSVRKLSGCALAWTAVFSIVYLMLCSVFPINIIKIFTHDSDIIIQAAEYLKLIKYTFPLFMFSSVLMALLRSVGTAMISFVVSVISLIIDIVINYTLIFGHFGFKELGIQGAAIGTLVARIAELIAVLIYLIFFDKKIHIFSLDVFKPGRVLLSDYNKAGIQIMTAQLLWAVSVPMQTAVLGYLSSDAIAANSVAMTFYQYLKVIVVAMSSASSVVIGNCVGSGNIGRIRKDARTLAFLDVGVGFILSAMLILLRHPLLSMYSLNSNAMQLADHLIIIMSICMITMSYQMPVSTGIIRAAGDVKFTMILNIVSIWCIVIPLTFFAGFVLKAPVEIIVIIMQSDQIFKCIPVYIRQKKCKYIHDLTLKVENS